MDEFSKRRRLKAITVPTENLPKGSHDRIVNQTLSKNREKRRNGREVEKNSLEETIDVHHINDDNSKKICETEAAELLLELARKPLVPPFQHNFIKTFEDKAVQVNTGISCSVCGSVTHFGCVKRVKECCGILLYANEDVISNAITELVNVAGSPSLTVLSLLVSQLRQNNMLLLEKVTHLENKLEEKEKVILTLQTQKPLNVDKCNFNIDALTSDCDNDVNKINNNKTERLGSQTFSSVVRSNNTIKSANRNNDKTTVTPNLQVNAKPITLNQVSSAIKQAQVHNAVPVHYCNNQNDLLIKQDDKSPEKMVLKRELNPKVYKNVPKQ
ncbi:hypothetical protein FQR65_LT17469 [Abscondita terminalis]|nr:hypothetical protein FQR65_LT17469 [Abscondita terminalis]